MKLIPFFRLAIRHSYYADGACPDFDVAADARTARLLANHQARTVPQRDGLLVAVTADEQRQPRIPLLRGAVLRFELRLRNPEFPLFTAPPPLLCNQPTVFRRAPSTGQTFPLILQREAEQAMHRQEWVWPAATKDLSVALPVAPLPTAKPTEFRVEGISPAPTLEFLKGPRVLRLQATALPTARPFAVVYPVAAPGHPELVGLVEVAVDDLPSASDPQVTPQFHVSFSEKQARWKYFLVTQGTNSGAAYSLEAEGLPSFARATATDDDPVLATLSREYPSAEGYLIETFVSSALIPCHPTTTGRLSLKRGAEVVLSALPAPSIQNLCTVGTDPGLFHILRRLSNA